RGRLGDDRPRRLLALVPFGGGGAEHSLGEAMHPLADVALVLRERPPERGLLGLPRQVPPRRRGGGLGVVDGGLVSDRGGGRSCAGLGAGLHDVFLSVLEEAAEAARWRHGAGARSW